MINIWYFYIAISANIAVTLIAFGLCYYVRYLQQYLSKSIEFHKIRDQVQGPNYLGKVKK